MPYFGILLLLLYMIFYISSIHGFILFISFGDFSTIILLKIISLPLLLLGFHYTYIEALDIML